VAYNLHSLTFFYVILGKWCIFQLMEFGQHGEVGERALLHVGEGLRTDSARAPIPTLSMAERTAQGPPIVPKIAILKSA
jgi:hypothetical protein